MWHKKKQPLLCVFITCSNEILCCEIAFLPNPIFCDGISSCPSFNRTPQCHKPNCSAVNSSVIVLWDWMYHSASQRLPHIFPNQHLELRIDFDQPDLPLTRRWQLLTCCFSTCRSAPTLCLCMHALPTHFCRGSFTLSADLDIFSYCVKFACKQVSCVGLCSTLAAIEAPIGRRDGGQLGCGTVWCSTNDHAQHAADSWTSSDPLCRIS